MTKIGEWFVRKLPKNKSEQIDAEEKRREEKRREEKRRLIEKMEKELQLTKEINETKKRLSEKGIILFSCKEDEDRFLKEGTCTNEEDLLNFYKKLVELKGGKAVEIIIDKNFSFKKALQSILSQINIPDTEENMANVSYITESKLNHLVVIVESDVDPENNEITKFADFYRGLQQKSKERVSTLTFSKNPQAIPTEMSINQMHINSGKDE